MRLVGLDATLLEPLLPGETEYSPCLSDTDFGNYVVDPDVRAVAKGVCQKFDQRKLAIASLYLQNAEPIFVATNDDPVFIAGGNGRLCPDVGATLAALETACDRKAVRIGKPDAYALQAMLADHFSHERDQWDSPEYLSQFCYVGDNIQTDIYFGKNAGIGSILVLSGLAKLETDGTAIAEARPTHILTKFAS